MSLAIALDRCVETMYYRYRCRDCYQSLIEIKLISKQLVSFLCNSWQAVWSMLFEKQAKSKVTKFSIVFRCRKHICYQETEKYEDIHLNKEVAIKSSWIEQSPAFVVTYFTINWDSLLSLAGDDCVGKLSYESSLA